MLNVKLRIMKTRKLLTTTLSFALLVFMSANVFGQDATVPFSDMTAIQTDGTDYVTVNSEMMYFVVPDPVLNNTAEPYDTTADRSTNGVNSTFGFVWDGGGTGAGTIYTPFVDADAPFRVVHFTGVGDLTLNATETSAGAGACPGTTTPLSIEVINEPSFTVGDADNAVQTTEICHADGAAGQDITINSITIDYTGGTVNIRGDIEVTTDNDGNGTFENTIGARTKNDTIYNDLDNSSGNPSTTIASGIWMGTQDGDGTGSGNITRYRYDFGSTIEGTDNNGINDPISRKSDYFENALNDEASIEDSDFQFYAASDSDPLDKVIDIIVYPEPSTGDIYFVPNDYNL